MSNMMTMPATEFFSNIKHYHQNIDDDFEQPTLIIPKLRAYQRRAVKWMIDRENNNDLVKSDGSPFSGGILADEMGLGKTVEMLSCIMGNISPPEFYNKKIVLEISKNDFQNTSTPIKPKPSTNNYISSSSKINLEKPSKTPRKLLEKWYESVLSEMSTVSKTSVMDSSMDEDTLIFECYCIDAPSNSTLVMCALCGKSQHAECVNFRPKPLEEVPYLCAHCWTLNEKIQCKATLIVVPQSILNQWIEEIEKHIAKPGLKVFIYNGVHLDGYIQPISFNDYDVVITSYTNLSKDLNYVGNFDLENRNTSRLRHSKKYNYPQSPLPCIKWWRICLDEGQAIESGTSKVSEMTSCLKSVHKWAMTGTPIQKSLNDLYGILKFLDVSPYYDRKQFLGLMKNEPSFVYEWFSKVIWRNSVEDVNSELNLPKLTTEKHWLTFSEIEKYFYQGQHDEYATIFSNTVTRLFTTLDISLKNIDKQVIYTVVGPLYKLRQACIHPQAVHGQFLKVKGTMTMDKLIDVMFEKCRVECNDILRSLVSEHNAIAGLYLICHEPATAVEHYRNVLNLMELYKEKQLKIDTCQKIHVMYNLSKVLDEHTEVSHALSDSDLKSNMELLEKQYLDGSKQNIESTQKTVQMYSEKVEKLLGNRTLGYSNWWSDILDWIFSPRDFLIKVQAELEDYRVPGVPNIANRLKSVNDVFHILGVWLADLDSARNDTISILKTLEKTPMNDLVHTAIVCHLRCGSKPKKNISRNQCLLCKAENQLQIYESLLFSVSNKQKNLLIDKTEVKDDETVYESTSKGLWKMSQKEFLLMKLFQYGQAKIINNSCLKDGSEHMKILDLVRKEFRYLRLLWTHLSDSLSAHDEIVMAKQRLRLGFENSLRPETDEDGPPKKKTKLERENDVIFEQYVDVHMMQLKSSIPLIEADLEKKIGTLIYLENLKKKGKSTETEPCPICTFKVDTGVCRKWAVLPCGHSVCNKCLAMMCGHSIDLIIACPMCRLKTLINNISYVNSNKEGEAPSVVIKGSFSTKIENITIKLMELVAEDPNVKVLVFSTWEKGLKVLGEALELNSINYRILKPGAKYKKTLVDFKTNTKINALLMKLSLGSKGLNLTEATRVFFMEPIINKADEHQAIGRIHRIGQTKPTFVHHFIIRDSIEENITNIFSGEKFDKWDDITLSQMVTVFERNQPNPDV